MDNKRLGEMIQKAVKALVKDKTLREDIYQDTWVTLLGRIVPAYSSGIELEGDAFYFVAIKNAVLDNARKHGRYAQKLVRSREVVEDDLVTVGVHELYCRDIPEPKTPLEKYLLRGALSGKEQRTLALELGVSHQYVSGTLQAMFKPVTRQAERTRGRQADVIRARAKREAMSPKERARYNAKRAKDARVSRARAGRKQG